MKKFFVFVVFLFTFLLLAAPASAHEAYVLTGNEFNLGLSQNTQNPLSGLFQPAYLKTTLIITLSVITLYFLVMFWATTKPAAFLDKFIKKGKVLGPLIIRAAISASFFYAAYANSILGPELSLDIIPGGPIIRFLLFLMAIMIAFGFLTEFAAAAGLLIFAYITLTFKSYMITYANYFGELIVLFLFGSRFLSIDKYLFGKKTLIASLEKFRELEIPIVRILYGIALMYAGWEIKFLHQSLSIDVYHQYHLSNFFHAPATFIASGAGLSEILIGLFIFLGLEQRLTTLISLFFITLSILYFRELLWPHFMLYGISFSIIINSSDRFTLDHILVPFTRKTLRKIFSP